MLAALLGLCISFHPCGGTAGLFFLKKKEKHEEVDKEMEK